MTLEQMKQACSELSRDERSELADFLLDTLDSEDDSRAAWDAEIDRRMEGLLSGKVKGIPAEEVFRKLREKYS